MVNNLPAVGETWVPAPRSESPVERERQPAPLFLPGEFHEQKAWQATTHGVAKVWHNLLNAQENLSAVKGWTQNQQRDGAEEELCSDNNRKQGDGAAASEPLPLKLETNLNTDLS